jgi:predicted phosphodiesterase
MRIAVVSDIHGNATAFEAVLADLRETSPDFVFHGGDLADAGASPVQILDRVCELGWPGVVGNTDEMLFRPEALTEFAGESPQLKPMFDTIGEMAEATRQMLGEERLAWLEGMPRSLLHGPVALVHASPESLWRAPAEGASDAELEEIYGVLGRPVAVYAHIHRPFVRGLSGRMIANAGSVSLSYDGDTRAAYLLVEAAGAGIQVEIRRVEYDVEAEIGALAACGLPHADWVARMLRSGRPQMP